MGTLKIEIRTAVYSPQTEYFLSQFAKTLMAMANIFPRVNVSIMF